MEKKMTFNYFYGTEADQFSFYRIPKALFTDSYFKDLSSDAKILYGLMLDRMSLSIKNQWFDDKNRAYIYFSIEDIMELLNCGRNKAIKSMRELDDETGIGLIDKRRQGFGKVNVIYVKTFMPEKTDEKKFEEELKKFKKQTSVENEEPTEVYISNFMTSQNQTSRSPGNKLQEVYISNPNNTNHSDTEMNDNKSNPIISVDEKRFDSDNRSEDYQAYENLVKETIDYESLEVTHHDDMRQVDEIVNLIVETVMCKNDKILIASNWYPASLVKKKFLMLTYSHIEYVLHCMSGNTTKVKNIKKYLLAALFNAPSTMNEYYQAEVNHDMPGLVRQAVHMFILKLAGKILLLPVRMILFVIGLAVKMTVQTYAVVRGILGFIFTLLLIATAYCYHDWAQVAFLFSLSVILYLILFAGIFVDTVLDMTRERIIDFIIS